MVWRVWVGRDSIRSDAASIEMGTRPDTVGAAAAPWGGLMRPQSGSGPKASGWTKVFRIFILVLKAVFISSFFFWFLHRLFSFNVSLQAAGWKPLAVS